MKKNWLIIVVIFLLSANLALFVTLLLRGSCRDLGKNNFMAHKNNCDVPGHLRFENHLAEELSWNEQQRNIAYDFGSKFHEKKSTYGAQLDSIREVYYTQLALDIPDTTILHQLAIKLGKIKGEMIILDYQHYRNLRSVCTPQQAIKMDSLGKIFIIQRHKRNCSEPAKHHGNR